MSNQVVEAASRFLQSKGEKDCTLELDATIGGCKAASFTLEVRKGGTQQATIGYDRQLSELFVVCTRSGDNSFDSNVPDRQTAPLEVARGQTPALHIFVDRRSVEVFASHGEKVVSELIVPSFSSRRIRLSSRGGSAKIVKLDIWKLMSAWQE